MSAIPDSQLDELFDAARKGEREIFEALIYRAARLLEEQRRAEFRLGRSRKPVDASDGRTGKTSR